MKTLEARVKIIYRFRCSVCKSLFEMTEEERKERDRKFGYITTGCDGREIAVNPKQKFECPICNTIREVYKFDDHKYLVMDNGKEIREY